MPSSRHLERAQATAATGTNPILAQAGLATRLAFFIAGFGLACWAPMVPFAKTRLGASPAELGTILLFLGLGSVLGMPATGALTSRLGSKVAMVSGSLGVLLVLPVMAFASSGQALAAALLVFGLSLGTLDVAANIHGSKVQERAGKPLMSAFHGFYSIGGLAGAAVMTAALSTGLGIRASAVLASLIILLCLLVAAPRFLATQPSTARGRPTLRMPHGIVLLLGGMTLLTFLVEGAVLDWGAILLTEYRHVPVGNAGAGFVAFSLTMTVARLVGDRFVSVFGSYKTLVGGALLTGVGVGLAAWAEGLPALLLGFGMAGFGAANIVPVLFSLAAAQKLMPTGYAIATASTLGYLGIFLGPGLIGHVAAFTGLPAAFGALAVLMLVVVALSGLVVRRIDAA